jgi:hypothetical protein
MVPAAKRVRRIRQGHLYGAKPGNEDGQKVGVDQPGAARPPGSGM